VIKSTSKKDKRED